MTGIMLRFVQAFTVRGGQVYYAFPARAGMNRINVTGKRADRPKLAEAKLCRIDGATLIIAKLDRLARNVAFISTLMESGVDFEAVDFPQARRRVVMVDHRP
jgi:hypothetical protein